MRPNLVVPVLLMLACACPSVTAQWAHKQPSTSPPARYFGALAYDLARIRTVLFGGAGTAGFLGDTWEWDGRNWSRVLAFGGPSPRQGHAMVYDFARQRVLLFGGVDLSTIPVPRLNDTWTYDGRRWLQLQPASSPPPRDGTALAYDQARGRVVLFGGWALPQVSRAAALNDTWEWDGRNWIQMKPATQPSVRAYAALAYDVRRQRTVLFGGYDTTVLDDTWEWDGINWVRMTPVAQPSPRCCSAVAYDARRGRVVLFGGSNGTQSYLADTWEYDGNNWIQVPANPAPPPRTAGGHATFDYVARRVVLFGGHAGTGYHGDTWEYAGPPELAATPATVSVRNGGTQMLSLDAGQHPSRSYWVLGSVTGTSPGVTLRSGAGSVTMPLNPDPWTDFTIAFANGAVLTSTRGSLDGSGRASASFNVPPLNIPSAVGTVFYHAFLAYDAQNNFYLASNPVTLRLVQ